MTEVVEQALGGPMIELVATTCYPRRPPLA
jgi:hypothetical protein